MKKGLLFSLFVIALVSILATVTFAEVDYTDRKQYNPQDSDEIDEGYRENQERYKERQSDDDSGKNTEDGIDSDQGRANPDGTVRGSDDNYTVIKNDSTIRSNPTGE